MSLNSNIKDLNQPHYYWTGAEATYQENPEEFIKSKGYEDVQVLEKDKELGWDYLLLKKGDEYTVAFRGVRWWHIEDWAMGFFRMLTDNRDSIKSIEKTIEKWEQHYRMKVRVLTGHSQGGWHATHVFKKRNDIWHITWNGHKNERGKKNVNMSTIQDFLSTVKILGGITSRTILLGDGSHSNLDIEPHVVGKTFQELFENVKHLNPSNEILDKLLNQEERANDLANSIPKDSLMSPEQFMEGLQNLNDSAKEMLDDLEKHDNRAFIKTMAFIEEAGTEVFRLMQGKQQEKMRRERIKESERQHQHAKERLERSEKEREVQCSYSEMRSMLSHQYSPQGINQSIDDILKYSKEFCENVTNLTESIQRTTKTKSEINLAKIDLNRLDDQQKEFYRKALKSQAKMSKGLRIVGSVLSTVQAALTPFAKAHPYAMAAVAVAKFGNSILEQHTANKCNKVESRYRRGQQRSMRTHEKLHDAAMENMAHSEHQHAERQAQVGVLLQHVHDIDPVVVIESLETCNKEFNDTRNDIVCSLGQKKAALVAKNREIEQAREASKGKHKKDRIKANERLLAQQADAFALQQEIESLDSQSKAYDSIIEKTDKELKEAKKYHSVSQLGWGHLKSVQNDNNTDNVALNRELQMAGEKFHQANRANHDAFAGMFNAADNLAGAMARLTGNGKIHKAAVGLQKLAGLGNHLNEINYLYRYFQDHALPALIILKEKYTSGGFQEAFKLLSWSTLSASYFVPGANFVTALLSAITLLKEWGYPVEPGLEKSIREIKEDLKKIHESWEAGLVTLTKGNAALQEDVGSIQLSLNRVQKMLFLNIEKGQDESRERDRDSSYNFFITDIERKAQHIQVKTGIVIGKIISNQVATLNPHLKHISGLDSATIANARGVDLDTFLTRIEEELNFITSGVNNGYNLGNNDKIEGNRKIPYECVDISRTRRNPESMTGLLARQLDLDVQMPNWRLLEVLTTSFLRMIDELEKEDLLAERIKKTGVRQKLVGICETIITYQDRLGRLAEGIKENIQSLFEDQKSLWARMIQNAKEVQNRKSVYIKDKQQFDIINFDAKKRIMMFEKDFVGSKKFYVYKECVQDSLFSKIPQFEITRGGDLEGVPNVNFHTIFDESLFNSVFMARTMRVVRYAGASTLCLGGAGFLVGPIGVVGVLSLQAITWYRRFTDNNLNITDRLDVIDYHGNLELQQQAMEHIFMMSIRDLQLSKQEKIIFKMPRSANKIRKSTNKKIGHKYNLMFDPKDRKIKKFANNISEASASGAYSFLDLSIDLGRTVGDIQQLDPKIKIRFANDSFIQPEEIKKIPAPGYKQKDALEYDNALKMLISHYFVFLDHLLNPDVKMDDNPFQAIAASSCILPSKNKEWIPLAFPETLIKNLEKKLNPELRYLEASGDGTLVADCYDFSAKDGKLQIHFNYISSRDLYKKDPENKKFCSITVAQIDPMTIQAFSEPGEESEVRVSYSELLVQAMYGSFGNLGLPGRESFQLNSKVLAPKEIPFEGMYRLWSYMPDQMININGAEYSEVHSVNLTKLVNKVAYRKTLLASQMQPLMFPQIAKDYEEVVSISHQQKGELLKNEEQYRQDFYLLLSLIKLFSAVDNKTLFEEFKDQLGLLPPDMQDVLFNEWFEKGGIPKVSEQKLDKFLELLKTPSLEVQDLLENRERILKLKEELQKK